MTSLPAFNRNVCRDKNLGPTDPTLLVPAISVVRSPIDLTFFGLNLVGSTLGDLRSPSSYSTVNQNLPRSSPSIESPRYRSLKATDLRLFTSLSSNLSQVTERNNLIRTTVDEVAATNG